MIPLSIITLGHVHEDDLAALTHHFSRLEQLVLDINPRDALSKHRPEFNRALDAASCDWILIVRERETIDDDLAKEVAGASGKANAWGYRARVLPFYDGRPLLLGSVEGEIRLFHKRHYIRFASKGQWDEINVQGTVVRLRAPLRSVTFPTASDHWEYLMKNAARQSSLRRVLRFVRDTIGTRTLDRNTLRYIWTEAAFTRV